jgi:hydrogenase expression/formation protein HypE
MSWSPSCVAQIADHARITLAHGEGGRLSRRLLNEIILPELGLAAIGDRNDAAVLARLSSNPVVTTDSFVVSPIFFPGGDIGSLAVYGCVNDLTVAGAKPCWLALSLILEEGLAADTLREVLASIRTAAIQSRVKIVTGDTKVVPRGVADQLFITMTGIGELLKEAPPGPNALHPGDRLLVSGPIGRHGIAILAARENLGFDPPPRSDCGSLFDAAQALREANIPVRAMRDATRGGLAAVLHEWAAHCGHTLEIEESMIPVSGDVRGASELLGLDPVFIACEGVMVIAVEPEGAETALAALRSRSISRQAAIIGQVAPRSIAPVVIQRALGKTQPLDDPAGRLMPRIC